MLAANVLQLKRELVDIDETVDGDALDAGRWGKRLEQSKFHLIERREGLCRSNLCNLEGQVHVTNRVADRVLTEHDSSLVGKFRHKELHRLRRESLMMMLRRTR